jgi:hypothetical protein
MVKGSCHCGAVAIEVPHPPEWVASCNCSICRRLGTLWAYYPHDEVRVEGPTQAYVWNLREIAIQHCPTCGCTTHWRRLVDRIPVGGVNARLLDDFDPAAVEVRLLDKAG